MRWQISLRDSHWSSVVPCASWKNGNLNPGLYAPSQTIPTTPHCLDQCLKAWQHTLNGTENWKARQPLIHSIPNKSHFRRKLGPLLHCIFTYVISQPWMASFFPHPSTAFLIKQCPSDWWELPTLPREVIWGNTFSISPPPTLVWFDLPWHQDPALLVIPAALHVTNVTSKSKCRPKG